MKIISVNDVINQLDNIYLQEDNELDDILNYLDNPKDDTNYYRISKKFFNVQFTDDDLLEYLSYRDNLQYKKMETILIDEFALKPMTGIFDSEVVYLYNLGIKCACEESFNLEIKEYKVDEIKELINKKIICPIKKNIFVLINH